MSIPLGFPTCSHALCPRRLSQKVGGPLSSYESQYQASLHSMTGDRAQVPKASVSEHCLESVVFSVDSLADDGLAVGEDGFALPSFTPTMERLRA